MDITKAHLSEMQNKIFIEIISYNSEKRKKYFMQEPTIFVPNVGDYISTKVYYYETENLNTNKEKIKTFSCYLVNVHVKQRIITYTHTTGIVTVQLQANSVFEFQVEEIEKINEMPK